MPTYNIFGSIIKDRHPTLMALTQLKYMIELQQKSQKTICGWPGPGGLLLRPVVDSVKFRHHFVIICTCTQKRHRLVLETGHTLLAYAKLFSKFWDHAFEASTFLINIKQGSSNNFTKNSCKTTAGSSL